MIESLIWKTAAVIAIEEPVSHPLPPLGGDDSVNLDLFS